MKLRRSTRSGHWGKFITVTTLQMKISQYSGRRITNNYLLRITENEMLHDITEENLIGVKCISAVPLGSILGPFSFWFTTVLFSTL